jgi:hypothetical protein
MRKLYFLSILFLTSCLSEENAKLGTGKTFIRYFNGGGNDKAVAFEQTSDNGVIILANSAFGADGGKIKLIKTDEQGNKVWSQVYSDSEPGDEIDTLKGYGMLVLPGDGGYVLTGQYLNKDNVSQLMVMAVDASGTKVGKEKIYSTSEPLYATTTGNPLQLQGKAITAIKDDSGKVISYFVLANILNPTGLENMLLAEINASDLSLVWVRKYGAGQTSVLNKLFTVAAGKDVNNKTIHKAIWAGTVTRQSEKDMRLTKATQNRQNVDFDLQIGNPGYNETAYDMCRFGFGYALIGSTNETTAGTQDILFQRLGEDGSVISKQSFVIKSGEDEVPGDKTGNGLAVTQDGGLLLIGTVPTNEALQFGRGKKDLYLIKMNAFGEVAWQKSIGSRDDDDGVAALQASDGGYLLLGTSTFAGLRTVLVIKTDNNGNIN